MAQKTVAYAWFTPRTFEETKWRGAEDLPEQFETWLEAAEREVAKLTDQGTQVAKVIVVPAELTEWCRHNRRPADAEARSIYAAIVLIEQEQARRFR